MMHFHTTNITIPALNSSRECSALSNLTLVVHFFKHNKVFLFDKTQICQRGRVQQTSVKRVLAIFGAGCLIKQPQLKQIVDCFFD